MTLAFPVMNASRRRKPDWTQQASDTINQANARRSHEEWPTTNIYVDLQHSRHYAFETQTMTCNKEVLRDDAGHKHREREVGDEELGEKVYSR